MAPTIACMLDAVDQMDGSFLAIVAVDASATDKELESFHQRGVRGAEVHRAPKGSWLAPGSADPCAYVRGSTRDHERHGCRRIFRPFGIHENRHWFRTPGVSGIPRSDARRQLLGKVDRHVSNHDRARNAIPRCRTLCAGAQRCKRRSRDLGNGLAASGTQRHHAQRWCADGPTRRLGTRCVRMEKDTGRQPSGALRFLGAFNN